MKVAIITLIAAATLGLGIVGLGYYLLTHWTTR